MIRVLVLSFLAAVLLATAYSDSRESSYYARCKPGHVRRIDGSCTAPIINKRYFMYQSPQHRRPKSSVRLLNNPRKDVNYVFVRSPEVRVKESVVVGPPQQKTLIYVLAQDNQVIPREVVQVPPVENQPEVYYVNYNDPRENLQLPGGINLQTALAQESVLGSFIDEGAGQYGGGAALFAQVTPTQHKTTTGVFGGGSTYFGGSPFSQLSREADVVPLSPAASFSGPSSSSASSASSAASSAFSSFSGEKSLGSSDASSASSASAASSASSAGAESTASAATSSASSSTASGGKSSSSSAAEPVLSAGPFQSASSDASSSSFDILASSASSAASSSSSGGADGSVSKVAIPVHFGGPETTVTATSASSQDVTGPSDSATPHIEFAGAQSVGIDGAGSAALGGVTALGLDASAGFGPTDGVLLVVDDGTGFGSTGSIGFSETNNVGALGVFEDSSSTLHQAEDVAGDSFAVDVRSGDLLTSTVDESLTAEAGDINTDPGFAILDAHVDGSTGVDATVSSADDFGLGDSASAAGLNTPDESATVGVSDTFETHPISHNLVDSFTAKELHDGSQDSGRGETEISGDAPASDTADEEKSLAQDENSAKASVSASSSVDVAKSFSSSSSSTLSGPSLTEIISGPVDQPKPALLGADVKVRRIPRRFTKI